MSEPTRYPTHPERLLVSHALEGNGARELIDELRARIKARQDLVKAAREARDLLHEIQFMEKAAADRDATRVHALLDAALKAYEG